MAAISKSSASGKAHQFPLRSLYRRIQTPPSDYTVIDLETTGLDPCSCEILEIGAIRYRNGQAQERYHTYVKPVGAIPKKASDINHIIWETVRNAPSLEEVADTLLSFINQDTLVGYNIGFDIKFIQTRLQIDLGNPVFDVLPLARSAFPYLQNHKLDTLRNALCLNGTAHSALDDCETTSLVMQKCVEVSSASVHPHKQSGNEYQPPNENEQQCVNSIPNPDVKQKRSKRSIFLSITALTTVVVAAAVVGILAIRANSINEFISEIGDAIKSTGLTEECGLDYVLTNLYGDDFDITVSLQAPIEKDSFAYHVLTIKTAIKPVFADSSRNLHRITFYLKSSGKTQIAYSTDLSTFSDITVWYDEESGDKLSDFGWFIYDTLDKYSYLLEVYPKQKFSVYYKGNGGDLLFSTGLGKIGNIVDTRSGDSQMTIYDTWDELAADFPALLSHLESK